MGTAIAKVSCSDCQGQHFFAPVEMDPVPERGDIVHTYVGLGSFFVVAREWVAVGSPKVTCRLVVERLSP